MKFYEPTEGDIKIGNTQLKNVSPRFWRDQCGVVMQEGYVFNDTIANNIGVGEDYIDNDASHDSSMENNLKEYFQLQSIKEK